MRNSKNQIFGRWATGAAVFTVFAMLLLSLALPAQQVTGRLVGTITDSTGAAVPNVQITITNQDTNAVRTVNAGDDGAYNVPQLPAGKYRIEVSAQGFARAQVKDAEIVVATDTRVDVKLDVGSLTQAVTVTGAAPLVDTTSSSVGNVVDEQRVADLPLNGRNWVDLTFMQPGINEFPSNGRVNGSIANSPGQTGRLFSSNGATVQSNYVSLDGANMLSFLAVNGSSGLGTTLGVDGIKEYKVVTSMFSAEYGTLGGSQTVIVSKGGSNQWHGDAFEYLRNSALDARQYFDALDNANVNGFGANKSVTYPGKRIPPFRRNNFGGAFGGPIKKDKTFFWAVFEGIQQQLGNTITTLTMPAACFIDQNGVTQTRVPAQIKNTGGACATGLPSPFTVPVDILPLATEFPAPNVTGYANFNYSFPFVGTASEKYGQIRVDHNLSGSDSLFVRYTQDDADQTAPTATSGSTGAGGSLAAYKGFELGVHSAAHYATIGETHIFSPTVLNTVRLSYSRTVYKLTALQDNSLMAANRAVLPGATLLSDVNPGSSVTPIGAFTFYPQSTSQDTFTLSEDIFWTKNKHSFKFGFLGQRYYGYVNDCLSCVGGVTFGSLPNFFQGIFSSITSTTGNNYRQWVTSQYGWYAQDDFRVNNHLTLNLGFRYEFSTVPREKDKSIEYNIRNPLTDPTGVNGPLFVNPSLHDFSPRVGLAWDVTGNGTTSVRAGAGIYYDVGNFGHLLLSNALAAPPVSVSVALNNPSGTLTLGGGPNGVGSLPLSPASLAATLPAPRAVDYNLKPATIYQYNLTIEHQFPWGMALSVGYVGSRGLHLMQIREANPTIPVALNSAGLPIWGCWNSTHTAAVVPGASGGCPVGSFTPVSCYPAGAACPTTTYNSVGLKPNLLMGQVFDLFGAGDASYNSLQVQVTKRLSQGLQFQFGYIYSKILADGANTAGIESLNANNNLPWGYNERFDRGPAGYDVTHGVHANFIYHVPTLNMSNEFLGKFVNGWWFSSILAAQTGNPFTPLLSGDRNLQNNTNLFERPDISPTYNKNAVIIGTPTKWFDPTMFSIPVAGQLGNVASGFLRGPGLFNMDFSIVKDTKAAFLGEAGNIEFRAEFFNALNHPNFALPVSTVWQAGKSPAFATTAAGPITSATAFGTAGQINGVTNNSRQIQLAVKIAF